MPRPTGARLARLTRLMALAIKLEHLRREGVFVDFAELARLGFVTRARMTQIMNLLLLAPDIQEEILFLPPHAAGQRGLRERHVRQIATCLEWDEQRRLWGQLVAQSN